jgi:hypothetical protein
MLGLVAETQGPCYFQARAQNRYDSTVSPHRATTFDVSRRAFLIYHM